MPDQPHNPEQPLPTGDESDWGRDEIDAAIAATVALAKLHGRIADDDEMLPGERVAQISARAAE